jgi:hypothetical protein
VDPFDSDNDWSDASSILSHFEFCNNLLNEVCLAYSCDEDEKEPSPQIYESSSSEEVI